MTKLLVSGCILDKNHRFLPRLLDLGLVEFLDLQDIASFLNVTPKTISKIRRNITFGKD